MQDGVSRRLEDLGGAAGRGTNGREFDAGESRAVRQVAGTGCGGRQAPNPCQSKAGGGAAVEAVHKRVLDLLSPALEAVRSDITMVSMTISNDSGASTKTLLKLVSYQVPLMEGFGGLLGQANMAASLLERAIQAPKAQAIEALRDSFKTLAEDVEESLDVVESLQPTPGLRAAMQELLSGGTGDGSVFARRVLELQAVAASQQLLQDTRAIATDFMSEVSHQVDEVRRQATLATDRSDAAIRFGTLTMIVIASAQHRRRWVDRVAVYRPQPDRPHQPDRAWHGPACRRRPGQRAGVVRARRTKLAQMAERIGCVPRRHDPSA